jgi:type II secretory pathway component PulK
MKKSLQGTAIFMALLIIVIVASITTVLLRTQHIDVKRTQMLVTAEEIYLYSQAVLDWAAGRLQKDLETTYNTSAWPLLLPATTIADGQGKIAGTLFDAEGLININNLAKNSGLTSSTTEGQTKPTDKKDKTGEETTAVLTKLFPLLGIPYTESQQQDYLNAVTAWMSKVNPAQPYAMDAYDDGYTRLNPPYRAPHSPMISTSEMRSVVGSVPALMISLSPYLVALPAQTSLKAEHAPELIQRAIGIANQSAQPGQTKLTPSQFYLLKTEVYLRDQHMIVFSLLKREASGDGKVVKVTQVWQSFGTS